jgi:tetratricopeptide (TPR) repeat protein
MGMVYFDQSALETSLKMFNLAILHKPDFVITHNNAGNALYRMKRYNAALKEYQTVASLDPGYIGIHLSIGKIYHDTGRFGDAINEYEKVLKQKPSFPEALKLLEITKQSINENRKK